MQEHINWIISKLEDWAESFNNTAHPVSHYEDEEDNAEVYEELQKLIEKLKTDSCTKEDYDEILFHLWQMKA